MIDDKVCAVGAALPPVRFAKRFNVAMGANATDMAPAEFPTRIPVPELIAPGV